MNDIVLQRQPNNRTCGQTSVAMAVGLPVEKVIETYGHAKATYPGEHVAAMKKLGWEADAPKSFQSTRELPEMALVRIRWHRRSRKSVTGYARGYKRMGHLVLWANGQFYDPTEGIIDPVKGWGPRAGFDYFIAVRKPGAPVKSVVEAAYEALSEFHTCPRCLRKKSKGEFGMRVVQKDEQGRPVKAIRQSYCRECR